MSDSRLSGTPADAGVEQLLREYAADDLFESPPTDLVPRAMAAIAASVEPCRTLQHARAKQHALIVLSIAAAGIFVAAVRSSSHSGEPGLLVSFGGAPHTSASRADGVSGPLPPERIAAIEANVDDRQPMRHASMFVRRPEPKLRWRSPGRLRAPKAQWTETVVSANQQVMVVPVVTVSDHQEPDNRLEPALAVVPLHSGLTYTEYDENGQR